MAAIAVLCFFSKGALKPKLKLSANQKNMFKEWAKKCKDQPAY